jgi:hypothetical protein
MLETSRRRRCVIHEAYRPLSSVWPTEVRRAERERQEAVRSGFVVLRNVGGSRLEFLGEVPRKRGVPARAARSQAILDETDGAARPGETYAAILRSEWRVSLDWKHPDTR